MKKYPNIDYAQRPESYWCDRDALAAVLRNVKGAQRRRMIADYWNQGRLAELNEELLKDTLSAAARERLGRIHPAFMGGEYLPEFKSGEAEIARIELASTTGDVISIRAQADPKGIRYRILDEYETVFEQPFETSMEPLTLGQLIEFIDGSQQPEFEPGLALCYTIMNAEEISREPLRHFTTVSSGFYHQLNNHYEKVIEEWVKAE
jgi:hypothetical protein